MIRQILLAACLMWVPATGKADDDLPALSVGGLAFGDFYAVPSHHLEEGDGAVGLVLRRGYLTFNADFSENWFGRARFEINQSGEFETYTFHTAVKDLYTGWNLGRQKLVLGLSSTVTYDLIESIWDFRYLVRTPLDLQGVPSRDTGVSLKGPVNAAGTISYRTMLTAPVEFGADSDEYAKFMGALTFKPTEKWTIDLYADTQQRDGLTDRTTLQAFAAYQTESLTLGAQYSHQDRETDPTLEVASAFVRKKVGKKTRLVGRVDRLIQPSPRGNDISYLPFDPSAPATMFIGGLEFQTSPHSYITPNFVVTRYDRNDEGVRPKTDVYLRLTLFINFE